MKRIKNVILIGLGFFFIGLGIVGILLPVLPATPFLILSTVCFANGSEKFHQWFIRTKLYLNYVVPAVEKKEMDMSAKKKTLLTLGIIFSISFFIVPVVPVKIIILAVALFHFYYFLFKIKTAQSEEEKLILTEQKKEREKEMLHVMIRIYCKGNHKKERQSERGAVGLCQSCAELEKYALLRTEKCPFMETKTFCSACKVHCYSAEKQEAIRRVMRYAGPRMAFTHPATAFRHMAVMLKKKRLPDGAYSKKRRSLNDVSQTVDERI